MTSRYTSAGRLLEISRRIRGAYQNGGTVGVHVPKLFGGDQLWPRGLMAYRRLIENADHELGDISEERQEKHRQALSGFATAVSPTQFGDDSQRIANAHFSDLVLERLEGLHDLLLNQGKSQTIEELTAEAVATELADLIAEIEAGEGSELDSFLMERLNELRLMLDNYVLYGPEGVQAAVDRLVGGIFTSRFMTPDMSAQAEAYVKRALRIAKGALDAVVYTKSGVEGIEWSGEAIAGLLTDN